jgi:diguanylate cyclase (GGDEF)-like protein
MPNSQLSILVVADPSFASAQLARTLSRASYSDIRVAENVGVALQMHAERPANILLADWQMAEAGDTPLIDQIRQRDETSDHYTYILLLTGRDGEGGPSLAFDNSVDDFISLSALDQQLVPRVHAAGRLWGQLQRLMQENRRLTESLDNLEKRNLIDPLTGLGNARYLEQKLNDCLRQIDSRGGALCYLLIGLPRLAAYRQRHGEAFQQELLRVLARRLQRLVRPLDVLCRLDDQHFAVIAMLDAQQHGAPGGFKRLHDELSLKPLQTDEGPMPLNAGIGMVSLGASALPLQATSLMKRAEVLLPEAYLSNRIVSLRLGPNTP